MWVPQVIKLKLEKYKAKIDIHNIKNNHTLEYRNTHTISTRNRIPSLLKALDKTHFKIIIRIFNIWKFNE